jgi:predicted amidohydrolase
MRIAIWQDETPQGGVKAALALIEEAMSQAQADGVDMLVFPECMLTGYYHNAQEVPTVASHITPSVLHSLQRLSDTTNIAFVIGSYLPTANGVANVALVYRPNTSGPLIYHKRALYGDWEKSVFQAGNAPLLFDYAGTRFAVLICFDVEFPELVREAARQGAQAVLVPTALMAPEDWVPDFIVPTRAIENNVLVAYANRIGKEAHLTFIGKSQLCDANPARRIVAPPTQRGLISLDLKQNPDATDYVAEAKILGLDRA